MSNAMAHERTIAGFALAGLACGDATGERALPGLAPALRRRADAAFAELATLRGEACVAFLRAASPVALVPRPQGRGTPHALSRALAAIAERDRTEDEVSLLEESGWLD